MSLKELENEVKKIIDNDSAHDFSHTMRVYKNAKLICKKENGNEKLVLSAALLHDIISYPKSDKRSKKSSIRSAQKAKQILKKYNYTKDEIQIISDAIRDHSFSRQQVPQTLVGKILQDADRLDAIGAIGIARVFAVGGSEKRPFYHNEDPFCNTRLPDDQRWTLDHFFKKLFKLEKLMNTSTGKIEAKRRTKILRSFISNLKKEI